MIAWLAPLLLAVLAIVDAGFAGYRAAAGRNPHIRKERYYRRAIRQGLGAGLVGCLVVGAVLGVLLAAGDPGVTADVLHGAFRLTLSFGIYATLVLLALGAWAVAEADLRTLASVLVLGPFTLVRPLWIVVTCVACSLWAQSWQGALAPLVAGAVQLAVARSLDRRYERTDVTERVSR